MHENNTIKDVTHSGLLKNISFWLLLVVTFLTPIFFVPVEFISTQFGTSLLFAFGVILALLLYIVSSLFSGSIEIPHQNKYILGSLILVPVVYTLAGVANGFSRLSFFGYTFDISTVGFMVLGFAYLFLVSVLFSNKQHVFYSYFAFVISSIILSVFLLIRIIWGSDLLSFGLFTNVTNTMVGSWNNVGIFFGVGVILSLLTYEMIRVSKFMKLILSTALVLSLFFLVLVNFSLIWMILAICSFLFILYSIYSTEPDHKGVVTLKNRLVNTPIYALIVLIISASFVVWGSTLGASLSQYFNISNVEVRPTLAVTLDIAKNTINDRPLFGSGPNTFTAQWLTWKPDDVVSTIFWNTDFTNGIGLIPTFAVTTGLLGILSWLLFLGFYLYLGVKSIFARTDDKFMKYLLTSSFFASLYLWIMTFVYIPSTVVFIITLFFTGLFFASIYLSGLVPLETRVFANNPRKGFVFSFVLVALFGVSLSLGYGLFKNSKSLFYFQKSAYAINSLKDIAKSEEQIIKAIDTVPADIYYRALSEIEVIKLNQLLATDPKTVKQEEIQKQFSDTLTTAIKAGIAAKDADDSNYLNWIALGRVYESVSATELKVEGAYESAQFAYAEALKRNPKNPAIYILFSRLAVARKDLKAARNYAFQAIQLKKNYLDAYFLLSQIEVADNNIKGAIDSVTAASVIDPTDPGIFFQLGLLKYNIKDYNGAIVALEKATGMTPDYANAKYFLGLSYDAVGKKTQAITEFERLLVTNPDSAEVKQILENLRAGKSALVNAEETKPEKGKRLPVKETR
ncbi:MAG: tetratricopeptide repeat protein [Candidatus Zambryskibacteria bacterium]|nr:tetratricopeptide repeat protein [Candidatus Zambryskibacteria bacterium]